jgi:hypothetical protein
MEMKGLNSARVLAGAFCSRHDEFDSANRLGGIPVDDRQIARRETLQFGFPSQSGDFHAQYSVLETLSPRPLGHSGAAYDRPCHQWRLGTRRQPQRLRHDFLQS